MPDAPPCDTKLYGPIAVAAFLSSKPKPLRYRKHLHFAIITIRPRGRADCYR